MRSAKGKEKETPVGLDYSSGEDRGHDGGAESEADVPEDDEETGGAPRGRKTRSSRTSLAAVSASVSVGPSTTAGRNTSAAGPSTLIATAVAIATSSVSVSATAIVESPLKVEPDVEITLTATVPNGVVKRMRGRPRKYPRPSDPPTQSAPVVSTPAIVKKKSRRDMLIEESSTPSTRAPSRSRPLDSPQPPSSRASTAPDDSEAELSSRVLRKRIPRTSGLTPDNMTPSGSVGGSDVGKVKTKWKGWVDFRDGECSMCREICPELMDTSAMKCLRYVPSSINCRRLGLLPD